MDGKKFVNVKALALPGSEKKHCLLGEHLLDGEPAPCFLVEGGPDWLAACWLTSFATRQAEAPRWVPLGFLGANCSFTPAQLRKLRGRQIRVFVHADDAGELGASRWADALSGEGCTIELVSIGCFGQILSDGNPVKDLNDALVANVANLDAFSLEAVQP